MSKQSWTDVDVDVDVPWIFVPLKHEDAMRIYFWIKRLPVTKEEDESLAKMCEKSILEAFENLGLRYDAEKYGPVEWGNLRLFSGSDGIAIPETCFINPGSELQRIENPLQPLANKTYNK